MDFKQLQDDTLDEIQELLKKVDVNRAKIKHYLNRGYYDFVRRTKCIQTEAALETVANQVKYDLDAWFFKIEQVRYIDDDYADVAAGTEDEIGKVLKPFPGGWAALPQEKETGTPDFYWWRAAQTRSKGEIGTWPIVDTSGYALKVWLSIFPQSDLSGDTEEPEIKEAFQDALVYYAAWRLFKQYSHLDREYKNKSIELRMYYDEMVRGTDETYFRDIDDELPETIDIYG